MTAALADIPHDPVPRRFLRADEAAQYLGLQPQTLARWRHEGGKIPYSRLGRTIVYDIADLEAFVVSRKRTSTSQESALADVR